MPNVFQCDREVAGDAGDHRVGITKRDHACSEMIAVLVHQPLAIAHQVAAQLQPLVEEIDVGSIPGREASIDDLDALAKFDAVLARGFSHPILAADKERSVRGSSRSMS